MSPLCQLPDEPPETDELLHHSCCDEWLPPGEECACERPSLAEELGWAYADDDQDEEVMG